MRSPRGWPPSRPRSTAPAWARSSPRRGSAGCCAAQPRPKAAPRPPPAAPPACPGPRSSTWAPGRGSWSPPGPGCCWCCPTWWPWTWLAWSAGPATPPPGASPPSPGWWARRRPSLPRTAALAPRAGPPAPRLAPAVSWLLSLLALKLTRTRRVSHVDDLLADPAAGLLAGLGTLPKKSALTSYSSQLSHDHQRAFLAALDAQMIQAGLATGEQAIFDLDFHAVLHWGDDPVLEKHYVPKRSQRARSVLTFFAQDSGTHNLVYANADLHKATQAREVIAFCDHWKAVSGADPRMLVMDQKLTNQQVLGELDARGVKFLTLRMRSPTLLRYINGLTPADYTTITLDRSGKHSQPGVHESAAVRLTSYPGTLRQLIVTGLGHDGPTVIITKDPGPQAPPHLPRPLPPAHRHRPGPRCAPRHHHQRPRPQDQGHHPALRPPHDHRAAPGRDHPRLLRRRPVQHRQPQRRPGRHALRARAGPAGRPAG